MAQDRLVAALYDLAGLVDRLTRTVPELDEWARWAQTDGYPSSSLGGHAPTNELDEHGHPVPPRSDPTARAVIARGHDPIREAVRYCETQVLAARRLLDYAWSRVEKFDRPPELPDPDVNRTCTHHARYEMHEPADDKIPHQALCRWCYDFLRAQGELPARQLLERRAQGRRILVKDVERAKRGSLS